MPSPSPHGGAAVIDTASRSQPPLWPSVGALLASGWAGGIAASMLWAPLLSTARFGSAFNLNAFAATSLLPTFAGALVAAVLLPRILRTLCEFELSLGAAFAVTLGCSLASVALSLLLVASFRSAVAPAPGMFVLPQILSLVVGYQLLKHLAQPVRRLARSGAAQGWLQPEPATPSTVAAAGEWNRLLPFVRVEIAQLLATLERAERVDVPGAVAEALPGLEALADRVEEAPPPAAAGGAAQQDLVAGIRALQGALVDLSETAWRGDHRHELEHLRGLDEIRRALAQLESAR
jgi:hypothetical protein